MESKGGSGKRRKIRNRTKIFNISANNVVYAGFLRPLTVTFLSNDG